MPQGQRLRDDKGYLLLDDRPCAGCQTAFQPRWYGPKTPPARYCKQTCWSKSPFGKTYHARELAARNVARGGCAKRGDRCSRVNISTRARKALVASGRPQFCWECGYDRFVEAAHVIPVKDFPVGTPVAEINDLSNLIWLCPNCHWEHDHNGEPARPLLQAAE